MPVTREKLVEFVSATSYKPVKIRELAKGLRVPESEYRSFRKLVRELMNDGTVVRLRGSRVGLPGKLSLKVGILNMNRKGSGFLKPEDGTEEIYVPPEDTGTALDSDRVVVRVKPGRRGKSPEAAVVKVLKRNRTTIVGTIHRARYFTTVEPDDPKITREIYVRKTEGLQASSGQKVVVALSEWKNPLMNPEGEVIEVLGYPDDPGVDILSTIRKFNLPTEFPAEVTNEADKLELDISVDRDRLDLRDKVTFTIDPADAKDYDDAVSLEILDNGNYLLGVHIADVSHYVTEGSEIDIEARERATSVYLVDRVLPMLPEKLSNEICSLKGDVDRLTYSCIMELAQTGRILKTQITPSIIHSGGRLSYDEVQDYFDNGNPPDKLQGLTESLDLMRSVAEILRKKRLATGSLDFDLPEPRVVLDQSGDVVDISPRPRKESHRLVEEFMLLANKAVAEHMTRLGLPTLYRVHDVPDSGKLEAYRAFVSGFGWDLKLTDPPKPIQLSRFLNKIEGKPEEGVLNEFLLRSLKKACYQPENIGHFGLAFKHYLHFTSPIRRYPDLLVHRLLKEIVNGHYPGKRLLNIKRLLVRVGEHSSARERLAEEAERETVRIKQAIYLSRHIGDIFEGVISGIVSFGFFVRLIKFSAEGMVRLSTLGDDYYEVSESRVSVTGSHTGNTYSLGERVSVQIINVDLERYQINLRIIGNDAPPKNRSQRPKSGKSKRRR
ncbi:MAG: ribonuclease R [candidate division Zixibacteria bacterium]|nr:ribonuclease R [candidate division Zixibacteria bacterium]MBU1470425.1 ribonuclease R [candidate division Zixibacteria bacterium]MBU2625821.1 ribonuclease R [candidate division Zixibacteria bacterium]